MIRYRVSLTDDTKAYYYAQDTVPTVPEMQDAADLHGFKRRTLGVVEEWNGHKFVHVKTEVVRYA
jgi:hypothetical protein